MAVVDWVAVVRAASAVERFAKPAVMVALIAAVLALDDVATNVTVLVVIGLAFGLVGDVLLLPDVDAFVAGLAAFLLGHLAYVGAFVAIGSSSTWIAVGAALTVALIATVGAAIVRSLGGSRLRTPVLAYLVTIAAMVTLGIGTGVAVLGAGAAVFALSDALLGNDRFVTPRTDRRVGVHMLYHLGQAGIVVGLTQA